MEDSQTNGQEITVQPIENMVQIDDGKMFTTSLIIAQAFEKEHKDVLKAISNLECSKEFHERNFAPMVYEAEIGSGAKREFPAYRLTRDGFAFLAMGFTGKKAAAWKEKFLEAFNAMEKALLAQRDGEAVPIDQDEVPSLPEETRSSNFFRSRRKIGKGDLAALSGILHLEALIQKETWENAAERLCRRMNITNIVELPKSKFNESVGNILEDLFLVKKDKQQGEVTSTENLRLTLHGLISFWHNLSDYKETEIRTYVFNRCGVDSLDELVTDRDLFKAILAVWSGLSNHSLKWKCW
ncbi:Rha family transcriptional regulator [uncultured Desulfovibrio sp.]|uniref:Rha family transcriptional regulator n=1 Tax=uncultured Desulfovibrio sp. TaxID=167968 RepID=UPI00261E801D|nr:Rha family transcriptional regulator [uncultured Desulfovibrio sp.]